MYVHVPRSPTTFDPTLTPTVQTTTQNRVNLFGARDVISIAAQVRGNGVVVFECVIE